MKWLDAADSVPNSIVLVKHSSSCAFYQQYLNAAFLSLWACPVVCHSQPRPGGKAFWASARAVPLPFSRIPERGVGVVFG